MRQSISPHERLTATLRFLATGRSYEDLEFSVAISPQALGQVIPETRTTLQNLVVIARWRATHVPSCTMVFETDG
ncbi:unnamed protein product [Callosobruchus maculatus]|uniref:Transcriptional regulator n=1 Tax=Callosobruchus maculatus TaxID=64391 RepID=A0A653C8S5_CALMS|nr:unnamed protein product [Callosobruchus maculatus]